MRWPTGLWKKQFVRKLSAKKWRIRKCWPESKNKPCLVKSLANKNLWKKFANFIKKIPNLSSTNDYLASTYKGSLEGWNYQKKLKKSIARRITSKTMKTLNTCKIMFTFTRDSTKKWTFTLKRKSFMRRATKLRKNTRTKKLSTQISTQAKKVWQCCPCSPR